MIGVRFPAFAGFLLMVLVHPAAAFAQTRICTYEVGDWWEDVQEIDAALAAADMKEATILLEVLNREWECLSYPVPPEALQRFAQLRAYHAFHSQDAMGAVSWTRLQDHIDAGVPWPEWVPEGHPIHEMLEWEGETTVTALEDQYIVPPKKGGFFFNGRYMIEPVAPEGTRNLVQVYDKKGERVAIYWQEGSNFRDEFLGDSPKIAEKSKMPKFWEGPIELDIPTVEAEGDDMAVADAEGEAAEEGAAEGEAAEEPADEEAADEEAADEEAADEEAAEEEAAEEDATEEPGDEEGVAQDEAAAEPVDEEAEGDATADDADEGDDATADAVAADQSKKKKKEKKKRGRAPAEVSAEAADAAVGDLTAGAAGATCEEPTKAAAVAKAADAVMAAWLEGDDDALQAAWTDIAEATACLDELLQPAQSAAVHRTWALTALDDDPEAARAALKVAKALDPLWKLSDEVPDDSALRTALAEADEAEVATVAVVAPEGATVYVDGTVSAERPATASAVVQLLGEGTIQWSGVVTPAEQPSWMTQAATAETDE